MSLARVFPDDPSAQLPDAARYRLNSIYKRALAERDEAWIRQDAEHAARHEDLFPCPYCVPEFREVQLSAAKRVIRSEFDEFSRVAALRLRLGPVMRDRVDSASSSFELDKSAENHLNLLVSAWLDELSATECSFPEAAEARVLSRALAIHGREHNAADDPQSETWRRIVEVWQACNEELLSEKVESEAERRRLANRKTFDLGLNFRWIKRPSRLAPRDREELFEEFQKRLAAAIEAPMPKDVHAKAALQGDRSVKDHWLAHVERAKQTGDGFSTQAAFLKTLPHVDRSDFSKILKTGQLPKAPGVAAQVRDKILKLPV